MSIKLRKLNVRKKQVELYRYYRVMTEIVKDYKSVYKITAYPNTYTASKFMIVDNKRFREVKTDMRITCISAYATAWAFENYGYDRWKSLEMLIVRDKEVPQSFFEVSANDEEYESASHFKDKIHPAETLLLPIAIRSGDFKDFVFMLDGINQKGTHYRYWKDNIHITTVFNEDNKSILDQVLQYENIDDIISELGYYFNKLFLRVVIKSDKDITEDS